MTKQLTLYTTTTSSPYAQRVEIALAEANVKFTRYEIDLRNKPSWFTQVNPAGEIPAITYGGPEVPADQPSPESVKLNESLVLVEFIADLYPESGILPSDPVLRAKARLFIEATKTKLGLAMPKASSGEVEPLVKAFEDLQALLPPKGFAIGEFSIADIAIAPFLSRLELRLTNNLGRWPESENIGPGMLSALQQPKLARWTEYSREVQARPSFVSTWNKDVTLAYFQKTTKEARAEKYGA